MYKMLESFLPTGFMAKEEMDSRSVLRSSWNKLVTHAEEVTDEHGTKQMDFKKKLLKDAQTPYVDVINFRGGYLAQGPMEPGTTAMEAVEWNVAVPGGVHVPLGRAALRAARDQVPGADQDQVGATRLTRCR